MSSGRRLIKDTLIYGMSSALARSIGLVMLPVNTHFLTVTEYGQLALLMSISTMLTMFVVFGMDSGVALVMVREGPERRRQVVWSGLLLQAVWILVPLSLLWLLAPVLAAHLLGGAHDAFLIRLLGVMMTGQVLTGFCANIAKWNQQPWRFLVISLGSSLATATCAGIAITVLHLGLPGSLGGLALGAVLFVPVGLVLIGRDMRWFADTKIMRAIVAAGLPFVSNGAADFLFPLLRLMLLGLVSIAGVAQFSAANAICVGVVMLNDAFSQAWIPFTVMSGGQDHARWRNLLRHYMTVMILAVAATALLAPPLSTIVLGHNYAAAIPLFAPIALSLWIKALRQQQAVALITLNRTWWRAFVSILVLGLTLLFCFIALRPLGITGVGYAMVLAETVGLILQSALLTRWNVHLLDLRGIATAAALYLVVVSAWFELGYDLRWLAPLAVLFLGGLMAARLLDVPQLIAAISARRKS